MLSRAHFENFLREKNKKKILTNNLKVVSQANLLTASPFAISSNGEMGKDTP